MTAALTLPRLEIGEHSSPFDEAVILIDGREEETITIECPDAMRLAQEPVRFVNSHERVLVTLTAAEYALQVAETGRITPELLRSIATLCETVRELTGAAA